MHPTPQNTLICRLFQKKLIQVLSGVVLGFRLQTGRYISPLWCGEKYARLSFFAASKLPSAEAQGQDA